MALCGGKLYTCVPPGEWQPKTVIFPNAFLPQNSPHDTIIAIFPEYWAGFSCLPQNHSSTRSLSTEIQSILTYFPCLCQKIIQQVAPWAKKPLNQSVRKQAKRGLYRNFSERFCYHFLLNTAVGFAEVLVFLHIRTYCPDAYLG